MEKKKKSDLQPGRKIKVYSLTLPNGKKYYGITRYSLAVRLSKHRWDGFNKNAPRNRPNREIYRQMRKAGVTARNFMKSIKADVLFEGGLQEALRKEQKLITGTNNLRTRNAIWGGQIIGDVFPAMSILRS
jgi:hypothetical protein